MRSRNVVLSLLASLVVVALAIGILLLVDSGDDEVALPDEVGDLVALDLASAYPSDPPDGVLDRQRAAYAYNDERVSEAFDGAAVGTRAYVEPDDEEFDVVTVIAIEADAGPLVPEGGFTDPDVLGLELPMVERVTDGDVECLLVRTGAIRAGADYEPEDALPAAITCQRRSGDLTVRARANVDDTDAMVDVVETLWDEVD